MPLQQELAVALGVRCRRPLSRVHAERAAHRQPATRQEKAHALRMLTALALRLVRSGIDAVTDASVGSRELLEGRGRGTVLTYTTRRAHDTEPGEVQLRRAASSFSYRLQKSPGALPPRVPFQEVSCDCTAGCGGGNPTQCGSYGSKRAPKFTRFGSRAKFPLQIRYLRGWLDRCHADTYNVCSSGRAIRRVTDQQQLTGHPDQPVTRRTEWLP
jgi:hypothetical protein